MSHERTQLRDAVATQLIAGVASVSGRVLKSRFGPLKVSELPAVCIYTSDEAVDPESKSTAPRELTRTVTVEIQGFIRADPADSLEDRFDAMALEIETAMDSDLNFSDTAFTSVLTSTETLTEMGGDRPMGCVRLVYSAVYHTDLRVAVADAARDEFNTFDVKTSLGGTQDDEDQAEDYETDVHE